MDQIHFVPCEPARHIPKPALEPWQAAAVAKFREIQAESAATVANYKTLTDRISRLVRQRTDERIYRERLLNSGAATDVLLAKSDEKLATFERLLSEAHSLQSTYSTSIHGLREQAFKALVEVGAIDEDFEGDEL